MTNEEKEVIDAQLVARGQADPLVFQVEAREMDRIIEDAEKQITIVTKIKALCLKLTQPIHWTIQGKEPYLDARGAKIIRERFGIDIEPGTKIVNNCEDKKGKYITVEIPGKATLRGKCMGDIGMASTRDKFFNRKGESAEIEDVSMTNLIKKAMTNLHNRLIKGALGFYPTVEDLKIAFGARFAEVLVIDFKSGGAAATDDEKNKQAEISRMLNTVYPGNAKAQAEYLVRSTAFKGKDGDVPGIDDPSKLRGKRLEYAVEKIKKMFDKWEAETGGATPSEAAS